MAKLADSYHGTCAACKVCISVKYLKRHQPVTCSELVHWSLAPLFKGAYHVSYLREWLMLLAQWLQSLTKDGIHAHTQCPSYIDGRRSGQLLLIEAVK